MDLLIMAAAVADYRPSQVAVQKIKKGADGFGLKLERTVDILAAVAGVRQAGGRPGFIVGFAAETENLLANAAEKMRRKHLDLIVANDVSSAGSGFEADSNRVSLLLPDGAVEAWPLLPKTEVAERILERIVSLWRV
jgi:phosphopantothenoylcysteine decarboxylase / phosphopantothenate---cysteine ligase